MTAATGGRSRRRSEVGWWRTAAGLSDGVLVVGVCTVVLSQFGLASIAQWAVWETIEPFPAGAESVSLAARFGGVVLANVAPLVVAVAALAVAGLARRSWTIRVAATLGIALAAGVLRTQLLLWVRASAPPPWAWVIETLSGATAIVVAIMLGLLAVDARRRSRVKDEVAAQALGELESEEVQIRQEVSQLLHGSVQQHLVVIAAQLDHVADLVADAGADDAAEQVRGLAASLDEVREGDVRRLSQTLFPAGVDIGLFHAAQLALARVPAHVATELHLGPLAQRFNEITRPQLSVTERLLELSALEEAVTNALKHGDARRIVVRADVAPGSAPGLAVLEVTIDDDGGGPPTGTEPALSGLARLQTRFEQHGGELEVGESPIGGFRLVTRLPFAVVPQDEPGTG
ncbi:sensor histidine kinase [Cellulomonas edaphi]|uniref:histidine kinase n=1 Tax=Cellulomonas edaphi TaxID=3053468 RepID=A0ABT7S9G9_9CELL|nr:ATP-binding protein [Cellulomons edaphi]MDM7832256.1 hypothetical protein [Cellulomons edaphi]